MKLFQKCCFTFLIEDTEERFSVTLFSFMFDTFHDMFLGKMNKTTISKAGLQIFLGHLLKPWKYEWKF